MNFKIAGRGMPYQYVLDAYLYFLVREEKQKFMREKIGQFVADAAKKTEGRK